MVANRWAIGCGKPRGPRAAASSSSQATSGSNFPKDELRALGYATLGPIAAGAFSQVVRARELASTREVAVKTYQMRAKGGRAPGIAPSSVMSEIESLRQLQPSAHRHIANLVATHESANGACMHLVMEACSGGSVLRHLQKLGVSHGMEEKAAASVVGQVASALAHMHALGVTHRDVKPSNLVFDTPAKRSVRLVDFGFAAIHQPSADASPRRLHTLCGTPSYLAPELARIGGISGGVGSSKAGYLGPPVDVWALGVLAYELLHNRPPFRAESIQQLNVKILKCQYHEMSSTVSTRMKVIVRRLLTLDVAERPSAATALQVVQEAYSLDADSDADTDAA